MPRVPLPAEVDEFLRAPHPAVVGTIRPDGSPHSVATWYDWDGVLVLFNMDASRLRLQLLRRDPRASLTVLDRDDWYRHVSLLGRVVSIEDDTDLTGIDRLAERYTGKPFGRRQAARVNAWLEPERWHGWSDAGPWP
jgi:PPOX class probable F420-dependent enzyme